MRAERITQPGREFTGRCTARCRTKETSRSPPPQQRASSNAQRVCRTPPAFLVEVQPRLFEETRGSRQASAGSACSGRGSATSSTLFESDVQGVPTIILNSPAAIHVRSDHNPADAVARLRLPIASLDCTVGTGPEGSPCRSLSDSHHGLFKAFCRRAAVACDRSPTLRCPEAVGRPCRSSSRCD